MPHFVEIPLAPPDSILHLNTLFKQDKNPLKVNLGVGAYRTNDLKPFVFPSIKKADEHLFTKPLDHEYLPIEGDKEYNTLMQELIFSKSFCDANQNRMATIQTIGGTGALKIGADCLSKYGPRKIYISDPTWLNHKNIFHSAGLEVLTYPYFDIKNQKFLFEEWLTSLEEMEEKSIVLLHSSCHNPSGIDPSQEEWKEVLKRIKAKNLFPLFDTAYHGFGKGLEEDLFAIRLFANELPSLFVCYSCSKNFGLYGERVGSFSMIMKDEAMKERAMSQIKVQIRSNYSSPQLYGSRLVKEILSNEELKTQWENDVGHIRERIRALRILFADKLKEKGANTDFSYLKGEMGMFSFCGLKADQVQRLMNEYSIYMVGNGRISMVGLSTSNIDYVTDAIVSVLK